MKPSSAPLFSVPGLDAIVLSQESAPALQNLLGRCTDFFKMAEGRPAQKNAAIKELNDVPPGFAKENLLCLGLRRVGDVLAGVLIALRHYPRENQWYISLFLLDPGWRGRQTGRTVYLAFENWVKGQNAEAILLAVVAPNQKGAKFWESVGFVLPRCYPPSRFGLRRHVLIEYEKNLREVQDIGR
jgi:GNAT superfamily N-acetyltransferase